MNCLKTCYKVPVLTNNISKITPNTDKRRPFKVVFLVCFGCLSDVLLDVCVSGVFPRCSCGVSKVSPVCYWGVSWVFPRCFRCVSVVILDKPGIVNRNRLVDKNRLP